jgi:hypothetical protein
MARQRRQPPSIPSSSIALDLVTHSRDLLSLLLAFLMKATLLIPSDSVLNIVRFLVLGWLFGGALEEQRRGYERGEGGDVRGTPTSASHVVRTRSRHCHHHSFEPTLVR